MYVEEIFVADTAEEAIALSQSCPPSRRNGWFTRYIPKERLPHEKRRIPEEVVDGEQLLKQPPRGPLGSCRQSAEVSGQLQKERVDFAPSPEACARTLQRIFQVQK